MPLFSILRFLFLLASLAILGVAGYLLWSWWEGRVLATPEGVLARTREDWRLWVGLALLGWSFLGRMLVLPLVARRDDDPTRPVRAEGRTLPGGSGSALHVECAGPENGPTLILTHGWGLDSTIWFYTRRDLASRFRIVAWDLPGLGLSKTARGRSPKLSHFADDLRTLVEGAERPVVLVGHSIGGMTIQTLARDHPELIRRRVAGVVLVNTTHTNPLRTMIFSGLARALQPLIEFVMMLTIWLWPLAWLGAWQSYLSGSAHLANRLGFGRFVTRSQLEHTTLLATRNSPAAQARGNIAMFHWDAEEGLAALGCPTLVIGGDKDIVTRLEASRTIASSVPGAWLEVVPDVNHMGFLERADVYNRLIADFASSVLDRPAAAGVAPVAEVH